MCVCVRVKRMRDLEDALIAYFIRFEMAEDE